MSAHMRWGTSPYDQVLVDIADYVCSYKIKSELAYTTARNCLIDTLGCGLEALEYPACTKLLGPHRAREPSCPMAPGCRAHRFSWIPVQAAFNIGDHDSLA